MPSRRQFLEQSALGSVAFLGLSGVPHATGDPAPDGGTPLPEWGLQIGDVLDQRAIVWSRSDRFSQMIVEWSLDERLRWARRVLGPFAQPAADFTARVDLVGLPADSRIFVRVRFQGRRSGALSEPVLGSFRTAPRQRKNLRFVWGGDTAGQGWGIDLGFGGMKLYEAMRRTAPDFFIHSGDNVYADSPMAPEVLDAEGRVIWRNAFLDAVPEKLKVAETLREFHRNYLYNRYDEHVRRFSAEVPQIWQWDDHEIVNNWSPSKLLDARYAERDVNPLIANGGRAFLDYAPMRPGPADDFGRIHRHLAYGPDLDLFVLDMRSFRAGNGCNVETEPGPATPFLGPSQLEWLKQKLRASRATWKIVAADLPLGLLVADSADPASNCPRFEGVANGAGPPLGRELELADLLGFLKRERVRNVVWLTADVHYAAAHYYDPSVARFRDFDAFWEFVAGPLHAGSFGPNPLDPTFGPTVVFQRAPLAGQANLPPLAGMQFFGQVELDARSKRLRVALKDGDGAEVFSKELEPVVRP